MKTVILPANSPEARQQAVNLLQNNGVVAFPTDTVYGLGAMAFNGTAIEELFVVKKRPGEKAIPILLADPASLSLVAAYVPEMVKILAAHFWPGPLTLVLPKHPDLPENISDTATVGVRIPAHGQARALLQAVGPMAVTSANLSGSPNAWTAREVDAQLGGTIPLILDGGRTPGGLPSTVIDCTGLEPRILRQGPISVEAILKILKSQAG
jgi:L-threonylcarbamoyladenylate synthase